jgi:hypothetical protein
MSPELHPEVRAEAAKALYEAETSGTHDFGLEPKPWAKLRPDTREYYLRLSDAVVSVVLPAQVDALEAENERLREERDAFKGASETWAKRYRDLNEVALNDLRNPDQLKARVEVLTAALTEVVEFNDGPITTGSVGRWHELWTNARAALAAGEEKS